MRDLILRKSKRSIYSTNRIAGKKKIEPACVVRTLGQLIEWKGKPAAFKGIKELVEKNFIAETMIQNYYFINPDFMFNGDRLSFVNSYILTESHSIKKLAD